MAVTDYSSYYRKLSDAQRKLVDAGQSRTEQKTIMDKISSGTYNTGVTNVNDTIRGLSNVAGTNTGMQTYMSPTMDVAGTQGNFVKGVRDNTVKDLSTMTYSGPNMMVGANPNKVNNQSNVQLDALGNVAKDRYTPEEIQAFINSGKVVGDKTDNIGADTGTTMPTYKSPNQELIDKTLQLITQRMSNQGGAYDPYTDPIFQQASERSISDIAQKAGRRGLLFSQSAKAGMGRANLDLAEQFRQNQYQREQQDLSNQYRQLAALQGLEQTDYNRYRDEVGDYNTLINNAIEQEQTQYNRGLDTRNMQIQDYGFALTPQTQQLVKTYQSLTPEAINQYRQYEGNYAARMNQLDPNSQEYQVLNAMRFNKIVSLLPQDPQTYGNYLIRDYGIAPAQVQQMIANAQSNLSDQQLTQAKVATEQFKSYIESVKAQYADRQAQADLDKAIALADKAEWDAFQTQIQTAALPRQIQDEILKRAADLALTQQRTATEANRTVKEGYNATIAEQKSMAESYPMEVQAYWAKYIEKRTDNPSLTMDQFLNMEAGTEKTGTGQRITGIPGQPYVEDTRSIKYSESGITPEELKALYDLYSKVSTTEKRFGSSGGITLNLGGSQVGVDQYVKGYEAN